jgi:hypothetical protein
MFQSKMMAATAKLYPLLGKAKYQRGASWRGDPRNFTSGTENPSGSLDISPAWFEQGHEVSFSTCKFSSFGS